MDFIEDTEHERYPQNASPGILCDVTGGQAKKNAS